MKGNVRLKRFTLLLAAFAVLVSIFFEFIKSAKAKTINISANLNVATGSGVMAAWFGDVANPTTYKSIPAGTSKFNAIQTAGSATIGDASGDSVTDNAATWTFANDTNFVLSGGNNGLSVDTSTLSIDSALHFVGIGTTTPDVGIDVEAGLTTTNAKFGSSLPVYFISSPLQVGFNMYTQSGINKFGAGSSSNYAGEIGLDLNSGLFGFGISSAGGNAGNTASIIQLAYLNATGLQVGGGFLPGNALDVNGNIGVGNGIITNASNTAGYVGFYNTTTSTAEPVKVGSLVVSNSYANTAPTNGLYVTGAVGIGTAAAQTLTVAGSIFASAGYLFTSDGLNGRVQAGAGNLYLRPSSGSYLVSLDTGGTYITLPSLTLAKTVCVSASTWQVAYQNTGACGTSSIKYKENVQPLTYGLDQIMKLKPVFFNYKRSYDPTDQTRKIGFIAEQVVPIVPEVAGYDAKGVLQNLDYEKLTALLAKGIQEQQLEIANLTLNSNGDLNIVANGSGYQTTKGGTAVTQIAALAELFVANINSGLIKTQKLIVNGIDLAAKLKDLQDKDAKQLAELNDIQAQINDYKSSSR